MLWAEMTFLRELDGGSGVLEPLALLLGMPGGRALLAALAASATSMNVHASSAMSVERRTIVIACHKW